MPTRSDLEVWLERLEQRGIAHSGIIDVPPGAILNFKDPDGIALALFWIDEHATSPSQTGRETLKMGRPVSSPSMSLPRGRTLGVTSRRKRAVLVRPPNDATD